MVLIAVGARGRRRAIDLPRRKNALRVGFLFVFTEIFDDAGATAWLACDAGIAAMQNQPVMTVDLKFRRNDF